jgi:hypothetical protein
MASSEQPLLPTWFENNHVKQLLRQNQLKQQLFQFLWGTGKAG